MASIPSLPYASRFVFRRPWRAIATITPPPEPPAPLLGPALSTVARRSCMPSPAAMRPIPAEPTLKTEPPQPNEAPRTSKFTRNRYTEKCPNAPRSYQSPAAACYRLPRRPAAAPPLPASRPAPLPRRASGPRAGHLRRGQAPPGPYSGREPSKLSRH